MTTTTETRIDDLDSAKVTAFAETLFGHFTSSFVTYMVDIGHRTGLFDGLSAGPATSDALAARCALNERYVREWLGATTTAGICTYDPTTGQYELPAEHAACLSGGTATNVAPFSLLSGLLAQQIQPVAQAFRDGGGVPFTAYRPDFTDVMDSLGRATFDCSLIDGIIPLTGQLADLLVRGCRVADIGCGTGHATNLLARAFPASHFVGFDIAEDAIKKARAEAEEYGLANVEFLIQDVAQLPTVPAYDAAFAFDAIHDQAQPATVLDHVFRALTPGGTFVMVDIRASSHLENNINHPLAPMLYGISTLHCMTGSLADGGAGLGTVWGQELAVDMLGEAGFGEVQIRDMPDDPFDLVYVSRKPGRALRG